MEKTRRFGDRRDGKLLRDIDAMHYIVPIVCPNRCDNEAYIAERVDLTAINEFLAKKNVGDNDFPYTFFHVILTALLKTVTLRPKLNRFICNKSIYQRNEVSSAFVVKKQFADEAEEALAFIHSKGEDTIDTIHDEIKRQVRLCRSDEKDRTSDSMDILNKLPRFVSRALLEGITVLDRHGWCPDFLVATDPYYSSVLISNLGSIKLKSGYHHLTNWGTCSLFCVIGEKKLSPFFDENGAVTMRETLDLGLTIDERLADGYYYSKSIRLLKKLVEDPELLERPLSEKVDY